MSAEVELRVFRGTPGDERGEVAYSVPVVEGMVVLDAIHHVQRHLATDLACRWNCKAARCGSCGAEVNGRPVLLCKTRLDGLLPGPVSVRPLAAFPLVKDLVTDVAAAYDTASRIAPLTPDASEGPPPWRMLHRDVERIYEMRRCIECLLCQDVCHVLRIHRLGARFWGPRFVAKVAALEMHPKDSLDRRGRLAGEGGLGYCNVTRCCSEVCPEGIDITRNAVIPLKERVADGGWRRLRHLGRALRRRRPGGSG